MSNMHADALRRAAEPLTDAADEIDDLVVQRDAARTTVAEMMERLTEAGAKVEAVERERDAAREALALTMDAAKDALGRLDAVAESFRLARFRLYVELLGYQTKPDVRAMGMTPLPTFYGGQIPVWKQGDQFTVDVERAKAWARKLKADGVCIVCLDIEHLPMTDLKAAESVGKMCAIVDALHAEHPALKVGIYGPLPHKNYWAPVNLYLATKEPPAPGYAAKVGEYRAHYAAWQRQNDQLKPLAERVDVMMPDCYAVYPHHPHPTWQAHARAMVEESRRIAPGKPVAAFLCWHFANDGKMPLPMVQPDYWRGMLGFVRDGAKADHVVAWGSGGFAVPPATVLDDRQPWWPVTRDVAAGWEASR